MKALFDAIRASDSLKLDPAFQAFRAFERANRGHRHLLDELALDLTTRPSGLRARMASDRHDDEQHRARRAGLSSSLSALFFSLDMTPLQAMSGPQWAPLMTAVDDTGLIEQRALAAMRSWATHEANRVAPLSTRLLDADLCLRNGELRATLRLACGTLQTERTLCLAEVQCSSLGGALLALERFREATGKLLAESPKFAEFSSALQEQATHRDLTGRLRRLLEQNFTVQERQWLVDHRGSLSL